MLDIEPAPRGEKREAQKAEIQQHYKMQIHRNKSITLTPLTEKSNKIASGQIVVIDGKEVDLCSNSLYKTTHIDEYILHMALMKSQHINTKQGFVINCFKSMRLFKELLARHDDTERAKYQPGSLNLVDEYVMRRLSAMVDNRLKRFGNEGFIKVHSYYQLKGGGEADIESVKFALSQALDEMGLRTEYQAYAYKETRERFLELRNHIFRQETGKELLAKRMEIEPLIYDEDELAKYHMINMDCMVTLTAFYDIFREKVCYDLQHPRTGRKSSENARKFAEKRLKYGKEAREIIQEYCVYETSPIDKSLRETFDCLDDIPNWKNKVDTFYEDMAGDITKLEKNPDDLPTEYDETDSSQKDEYNFYALANCRSA